MSGIIGAGIGVLAGLTVAAWCRVRRWRQEPPGREPRAKASAEAKAAVRAAGHSASAPAPHGILPGEPPPAAARLAPFEEAIAAARATTQLRREALLQRVAVEEAPLAPKDTGPIFAPEVLWELV